MNTDLALFFAAAAVAILNPTLLAAVMVMLLLPHPKRLMLGYLSGAYAISIAAGLAIVFTLHGSTGVKVSGHILGPGEDIAGGVIGLAAVLMLVTGHHTRLRMWYTRRKEIRASERGPKPPWQQRMLGKGSAGITFAAGIVMSFPGVNYLSALRHIADLDLSVMPALLLVLFFCLMQQILLELALLASLFAPAATQAAVARAGAWLGHHRHRIAIIGLAGCGSFLLVRGLIAIS